MKGKIFIIEDEASIVQLVQHNLEKEGFVVSSSLNGNEGLKELKKFEPNLLLLDWMLPDLSGIDICKNIRRDSNFKSLPIIMLTAKGEEEDKIKGLESGVDDYVTKPFFRSDKEIQLGPTEFRLLEFFLTNPKRVYSRDQILETVWPNNVNVESRTIDVHIRRLRQSINIEGKKELIRTVRAAGYSLI